MLIIKEVQDFYYLMAGWHRSSQDLYFQINTEILSLIENTFFISIKNTSMMHLY